MTHVCQARTTTQTPCHGRRGIGEQRQALRQADDEHGDDGGEDELQRRDEGEQRLVEPAKPGPQGHAIVGAAQPR